MNGWLCRLGQGQQLIFLDHARDPTRTIVLLQRKVRERCPGILAKDKKKANKNILSISYEPGIVLGARNNRMSRKRPSCFLEETGKESHKQMSDCMGLRSKNWSSQVQGHGWGVCTPWGERRVEGRRNVVSPPLRSSSFDLSRGPLGTFKVARCVSTSLKTLSNSFMRINKGHPSLTWHSFHIRRPSVSFDW